MPKKPFTGRKKTFSELAKAKSRRAIAKVRFSNSFDGTSRIKVRLASRNRKKIRKKRK